MAKVSYLSLIILTLWLSFFQILSASGYNVGEFSSFPLEVSEMEILLLLSTNCFVFFVFFILDFFLSRHKILFTKKIFFKLRQRKLNSIFFILLVLQLLFLVLTGVGRLMSDATHPLSPLFSLFSPEAFLPVYYLLNRESNGRTKNKLFFLNIVLFSSFKLLQGWSSFILILFFLELLYRTKNVKLNFKTIFIATLLPLLIIFSGGVVYKYVYQLKNQIRGTPVEELSYFEGASHLASRLSMAPVSIAAYDRFNSVVGIFNKDSYFMKEIQGLGRPILPRFIMKDKEFRPLGNNIMEVYYPDINSVTSSNMGLVMYFSVLYSADTPQAIMFIILLVFLIFICKLFIDNIEQKRGQLQFVLFLVLMNVADIASLEIVFGYGFLKLISVFLLCLLFGGFKVVSHNESGNVINKYGERG